MFCVAFLALEQLLDLSAKALLLFFKGVEVLSHQHFRLQSSCLYNGRFDFRCGYYWLLKVLMSNCFLGLFMNKSFPLLMNYLPFLLVNHFLLHLMDDGLMDFMDMLLVDHRLMDFMNHRDVLFMYYIPVNLIDDILVVFVNDILVGLFNQGCSHVLLYDGGRLMLNDLCLFNRLCYLWLFFMLDHYCFLINSFNSRSLNDLFASAEIKLLSTLRTIHS